MSDALPDPDRLEISMCGKTWTVVAQRVARIEAGLGDVIAAAAASGQELTPAAFYRLARGRLYDVLVALIPGMEDIPEWKFRGYVSSDDFEADKAEGTRSRYRALADNSSPTEPELEAAFRAALEVNRVNAIVSALLDPKVVAAIKAEINAAILDQFDSSLSSLPRTNGTSTLTTSSTLAGIENEATASPGLVSSG